MKICTTCKRSKPFDAFSAKSGSRDGLQSYCKACRKERYQANRESEVAYAREYAQRNRVSVISYKRAYNEANKEKVREQRRLYTLRHGNRAYAGDPVKAEARKALKYAVRWGKIAKPTHCEDCTREFPKAQLHGHHEDYSKPLDVNWLCAPCHGRRHRVALEGVAA